MDPTGERLARMEAILERMNRELFGNGQPGRLQILEAKIEDGLSSVGARVKFLEEWRLYIMGGAFVAGLVAGTIVSYLLKRFA